MSQICRLCLSDQHLVQNIFECNIKELPEKILRCTSVEVVKDDGFPNTACSNCIQMITQFDSFRKQCQYSDDIIKKRRFKSSLIHHAKWVETNDCFKVSNTDALKDAYIETNLNGKTLKNLLSENKTANRYIQNNELVERVITEKSSKGCLEIYNDSNVAYSGDVSISDHSENFDDLDYDLQANGDHNSSTDYATSPPKTVVLGKKKCKIKTETAELKRERGKTRHHLVYSEQDYAILSQERKVRIYEIDDTMLEIIGNNVYICEICSIEFTTFFDYYDHQDTHNGNLVFKCSKCTDIFSSRQNLVEHDARHKIPCKVCDLEVLPKSMSAHLLIHTDIHKCPECGMRHTSNASLEKHIKARHTGIKGFVCHVCGKQSSCQSSMNRHMAYHSAERPYKCKYCDFCAKSLNIVQVHTSRKHFAEKCVCEICAKLFKSQPSLIQHMKRIHTVRKHICDICGKAFIERYNLNRHLKKHAGQRLHECKLCHKEFFTIRKLKEHMHSHRQGCVNCPKCGKEFFYKKYCTKHVLKCTKTDDFNSSVTNGNNCIPVISHYKQ